MTLQNLQFTTTYPTDKAVLLKEKAFTPTVTTNAAGNPVTSYSEGFTHGLPAIPFCSGQITFDNWQTTYQAGFREFNQQYYSKTFDIRSDNTSIEIDAGFEGVNSNAGVYQIWAFFNEPDTLGIDAPATADLNQNRLYFNTENNYQRLVAQGITNATGNNTNTVAHNLGYYPYMEVWRFDSYNNKWALLTEAGSIKPAIMPPRYVCADAQNAYFYGGQYYYRIYAA